MHHPNDLNKAELVRLVTAVQRLAFGEDFDDDNTPHRWDQDKELGADFIGGVCAILADYRLSPEDTATDPHDPLPFDDYVPSDLEGRRRS